jgi:hypothetical protein
MYVYLIGVSAAEGHVQMDSRNVQERTDALYECGTFGRPNGPRGVTLRCPAVRSALNSMADDDDEEADKPEEISQSTRQSAGLATHIVPAETIPRGAACLKSLIKDPANMIAARMRPQRAEQLEMHQCSLVLRQRRTRCNPEC